MKKLIFILLPLITSISFSQPKDKFQSFRDQKKTIELSTGISMKYIEVNPAGKEALFLLHGVTDTGRSFQATLEELQKIGGDLRIIVPDLRGHGETSMPPASGCEASPVQCFTPADFTADIIDLMHQLGIDSAHITGHSMGSVIAQELALKYPQKVRKLVLIGSFARGVESVSINQFLKQQFLNSWKDKLVAKNPAFKWPADAYLVTPLELGNDVTAALREMWVSELAVPDDYLNNVHQETIRIPIGTWYGAIYALGNLDNTALLEGLTKPTLVLWPTQDMAFPKADQTVLKASLTKAAQKNNINIVYKTYGRKPLPQSNMQESDLGHNLHWAAPKQVASDIEAFIRTGHPVNNLTYLNGAMQLIAEDGKGNVLYLGK